MAPRGDHAEEIYELFLHAGELDDEQIDLRNEAVRRSIQEIEAEEELLKPQHEPKVGQITKRVRFNSCPITQVTYRPRTRRQDRSMLYYSQDDFKRFHHNVILGIMDYAEGIDDQEQNANEFYISQLKDSSFVARAKYNNNNFFSGKSCTKAILSSFIMMVTCFSYGFAAVQALYGAIFELKESHNKLLNWIKGLNQQKERMICSA